MQQREKEGNGMKKRTRVKGRKTNEKDTNSEGDQKVFKILFRVIKDTKGHEQQKG